MSADEAHDSITHPARLLALLGEHAYKSAADASDVEPDDAANRALDPTPRSTNDEDAICRAHLPLAHALARHVHAQISARVDLETLCSAARMGLFEAARRYDAARGVPFEFFAKTRILGALFDELRTEHIVKRSTVRRPAELQAMLHACGGVAEARTLVEDESLAWIGAWRSIYGVRTMALGGVVDDDAERADEVIEREELFARVRAAVAELEPRHRALIKRVFFDERSLVAVGTATGLSRSWTCRLVNEAIGRVQWVLRRRDARETFSLCSRSARRRRRTKATSRIRGSAPTHAVNGR